MLGISQERLTYCLADDFSLSPQIPKLVEIAMRITEEEYTRYLRDGLVIGVHGILRGTGKSQGLQQGPASGLGQAGRASGVTGQEGPRKAGTVAGRWQGPGPMREALGVVCSHNRPGRGQHVKWRFLTFGAVPKIVPNLCLFHLARGCIAWLALPDVTN